MKTVKEVSQLVGLSVRTLHYYDEIDLLKPTLVGDNGYRFYDDYALVQLQDILLFRELDFPLKTIKTLLDSPAYVQGATLADQIRLLEMRQQHLQKLIQHTRALQEGGEQMVFMVCDHSHIQAFEEEVKERWGKTDAYVTYATKTVMRPEQLWQDMREIFRDFGDIKDQAVSSQAAQKRVAKLQDYISQNLYPCEMKILESLGLMYVSDQRFKETIDQMAGIGTATFVSRAISHYCRS
ncbi:MerR family transcriptional regulator [Streptococcus dysgalactiae]|uniref:MerR family transcriptional regulator n=1 Tax=Streptococcus dysgalactiae TaxID=1334 RepID=UPI001CF18B6A|nr:MerR family transcriptional regulator [Streptococcus dysgalactiae]MCB2828824.1 MerR family transcriptional regulator [Streptococcus dysgalactiae subsp. dysgalactiae]MCB2831887.1 MerR family transcriptional regulator [Streptococcus dysgalactiae subsp. dysgalactiae]MCB2834670.1 MerR family transcriptional regulator [Streptococcus dysgalactiae subsp. dysgalactiae]MCB2836856.1 MerR family transcriptional regulator [Streptococcus dysgalactiae subsp. dysgalactiae]MCB2838916.1 MerR family transcri